MCLHGHVSASTDDMSGLHHTCSPKPSRLRATTDVALAHSTRLKGLLLQHETPNHLCAGTWRHQGHASHVPCCTAATAPGGIVGPRETTHDACGSKYRCSKKTSDRVAQTGLCIRQYSLAYLQYEPELSHGVTNRGDVLLGCSWGICHWAPFVAL